MATSKVAQEMGPTSTGLFKVPDQTGIPRPPTRQNKPKFMVPDQPNAYQGPRPAKFVYFRDKQCLNCDRMGHIAPVCRQPKRRGNQGNSGNANSVGAVVDSPPGGWLG